MSKILSKVRFIRVRLVGCDRIGINQEVDDMGSCLMSGTKLQVWEYLRPLVPASCMGIGVDTKSLLTTKHVSAFL